MKARTILTWLISCLMLCAIAIPAQAASPQDTLNQYVADLQKNPDDSALREKIIAFAQTVKPAPAIPAESHRHFIRGSVFGKEAKTDTEFESAVKEYRQAIQFAPWWGGAYYNLAMVLKASGQFDEATANLKLALLAHMEEKDAKDAQEQIYAIEVEKELSVKRKTAAQATANRQTSEVNWLQLNLDLNKQDRQEALLGPWACASNSSDSCNFADLRIIDGNLSGTITANVTNGTHAFSVGGTVKNSLVDGDANFSSYDVSACTVPAYSQNITGTVSEDGRSMNLKTTFVAYDTQSQGLLITTCVSVSPGNSSTLRMKLTSKAPPLIPIIAIVKNKSADSLHISQLEAIKLVAAHGGNINVANGEGKTALHFSAQHGNKENVAFLLENGAQINAEDKNFDTPLNLAAESNSVETVQLLLERGAKPDGRLDAAGYSPLYKAVWQGDPAIVELMLKYTKEQSPIDGSLSFLTDKNLNIAKLLFDRGAQVNIAGKSRTMPLVVALVRGCGDAYAENYFKGEGTKRFPCAQTDVAKTVAMLLEHGAKVDIPDQNGTYPLMRAAETGNLYLVKLLIANRADIYARDDYGHSALQYAKDGRGVGNKKTTGNQEVVKFLEGQGVKK